MNRTPIHPGTISGEELDEIGISAAELARQLKIPTNCITQIIACHRNITPLILHFALASGLVHPLYSG